MSWVGIIIGIYLLVGYSVYRYIGWLLNVKHAEHFKQEDKTDYDGVSHMLIVMIMWPKLVLPWIWGAFRAVQEDKRKDK